jgi:hypothetical protein
MRMLVQPPVAVEKLFRDAFSSKFAPQAVEFSFDEYAESGGNLCLGSFFNSHAWSHPMIPHSSSRPQEACRS